ncbi:GNAT family N-acetyltransferase [Micromonospora sp. NPDC050397]|uniref:GNAT family N-acetyltransferase n=1 Tax=Micromonospora sp. NPDC050397 TaxID=3364279 RepID=UPI00384F00DB
MNTADLAARLGCVGRTWTPQQRLHPGNVAWASARGDGSTNPDIALTWGNPLWGFADIWLPPSGARPASVTLHLAPGMTAHQLAIAIDEVLRVAPHVTAEVSLQQTELVDALSGRGFHRADGPWFAQLWRGLADLSDLRAHHLPDGYSIRRVRRDELVERVEVHRRCWDPVRIKQLLNLPVTGEEPGSSYSIEKHLAVIGSPVYREELDLVVEAADGSLAAFALGWLDPEAGSILFEPVGTVPAHAERGLARALCAELLRVARDLGATQAVVGPRGDGAYRVPRKVYEGLGMREVAQFVSFTNR